MVLFWHPKADARDLWWPNWGVKNTLCVREQREPLYIGSGSPSASISHAVPYSGNLYILQTCNFKLHLLPWLLKKKTHTKHQSAKSVGSASLIVFCVGMGCIRFQGLNGSLHLPSPPRALWTCSQSPLNSSKSCPPLFRFPEDSHHRLPSWQAPLTQVSVIVRNSYHVEQVSVFKTRDNSMIRCPISPATSLATHPSAKMMERWPAPVLFPLLFPITPATLKWKLYGQERLTLFSLWRYMGWRVANECQCSKG